MYFNNLKRKHISKKFYIYNSLKNIFISSPMLVGKIKLRISLFFYFITHKFTASADTKPC